MIETYLLYFFIGVFIVQLVSRTAVLLLANWYDFRRMNQSHRASKGQKKRLLISVIILAQNHETTIAQTLQSVAVDDYTDKEVIVIDNASTDDTWRAIDAYTGGSKAVAGRIRKRKRADRKGAFLQAHAKARGKIVLFLDGDDILGHNVLKNVSEYFSLKQDTQALVLAKLAQTKPSLLGLMQRFDYLIFAQERKAMSMFNLHDANIYDSGMAYRSKTIRTIKDSACLADAFKTKSDTAQPPVAYDSRSVVYVMPQDSAKILLLRHQYENMPMHNRRPVLEAARRITVALKIVEPFMIGYFFYLAYSYKSGTLFLLTWVATFTWLGLIIWSSEGIGNMTKLRLLVLVPAMYVLSFFRSIAISVATIIKPRHISKA